MKLCDITLEDKGECDNDGFNRAEMKVEIKIQKFFDVNRYFCIDGEPTILLESLQSIRRVYSCCFGQHNCSIESGSTILQSCIVKKF